MRYFDSASSFICRFFYYRTHNIGRRWNRYNPIEDICNFSEHLVNIFHGYEIQFSLWTERVAYVKRLDFMTFPRLIVVAEAYWTSVDVKETSRFKQKLPYYLELLDDMDIYYFNPFNPESTLEPHGHRIRMML